MSGLVGWLRRVAAKAAVECAGCGAVMDRTALACPQGCGYDRRTEQRLSGGSWARLDRL